MNSRHTHLTVHMPLHYSSVCFSTCNWRGKRYCIILSLLILTIHWGFKQAGKTHVHLILIIHYKHLLILLLLTQQQQQPHVCIQLSIHSVCLSSLIPNIKCSHCVAKEQWHTSSLLSSCYLSSPYKLTHAKRSMNSGWTFILYET